MTETEAREAEQRWQQLPANVKAEMEAEFARRCQEWAQHRDFYERKSVWKHVFAAAVVFGVAGLASGWMAVAYLLIGAFGGKLMNRRKGGVFTGTLVGAGVFVAVLIIRTALVFCLSLQSEAFLMYVAQTQYADRIGGLVCPAGGGLLGYLIENEFDLRG